MSWSSCATRWQCHTEPGPVTLSGEDVGSIGYWFTPGVALVLSCGAQRTMMRVIWPGGVWMVSFDTVSTGLGAIVGPTRYGVGSRTIARDTGMWPFRMCHCCA